MNMQELIIKKRNGFELSQAEIDWLVGGISDHSLPDYQIAAWAMAVYFQGMSERETRDLTMAMAFSGDVVDLSDIPGIKVDKHSTGGVGDKTTLIILPLVAAAGVPVAKMSGRGLGHTGGTIDKLESIPGFKVEQDRSSFIKQVREVKAAVIAQSGNLVPADKRLYAIRDVTGTVESIPLIASSVMSKKIAAGAEGILLDVKVGQGAFMKDLEQAVQLARTMVKIGAGAGRRVVAVISDMNQPLGQAVGNALEVKEAIQTLMGQGPVDLEEACLYLAAHMLVLGGRFTELKEAESWVKEALCKGWGLTKLKEIVASQGGCLDFSKPGYGLPQAPVQYAWSSRQSGYIRSWDALQVGITAARLGAGRERLGEPIDPAVGVELCKKVGEAVQENEVLAIIHARCADNLEAACRSLQEALRIDDTAPELRPLIIETIS
ncbi:MAG: pyrimidine-nucleoside phosphorylase [Syntrophomonas sp.]